MQKEIVRTLRKRKWTAGPQTSMGLGLNGTPSDVELKIKTHAHVCLRTMIIRGAGGNKGGTVVETVFCDRVCLFKL